MRPLYSFLFLLFLLSSLLPLLPYPTYADGRGGKEAAGQGARNECVILLHGLARTSKSMNKAAQCLTQSGYYTANISYPSRKKTIPELAEDAVGRGIAACRLCGADTIHFVTHSMGGILVRWYFAQHRTDRPKELGRVVMLAPPNGGSEVVDKWQNMPGFFWLNGRAGMQLGTDKKSIPSRLGAVDYETGIIAGTKSFNPILSLSLPNPDDGKVSLEKTKVAGMKDFIALPVTHTFIMKNDSVIEQVKSFLATGSFLHKKDGKKEGDNAK